MTIEFDTTRPIRGNRRLTGLLRFVLASDPNNETDWIEWKTSLDLTTKQDQFAVAKQILGFGNRHPDRARHHGGGCGFFVLGVEPDNLVGQTPIDPADLQSSIERYVGHGAPAWSPIWVDLDGVRCLVITVEPPEWGDPIHTLLRESPKAVSGQIFVRRSGGTHPASPAEVSMLSDRLANGPSEAPLVELLNLTGKVTPTGVTDKQVDDWIDREREWFLSPVDANEPRPPRITLSDAEAQHLAPSIDVPALRDAHRTAIRISGLFDNTRPEPRSEEEYRAEIEDYLNEARSALPMASFTALLDAGNNLLKLELRNPTVRNLPALQLVVTIDGLVAAYDELPPRHSMPDRPRRWGPVRSDLFPYLGISPIIDVDTLRNTTLISAAPGPGYETENSDKSTRITFDPIDLRPEASAKLPPVDIVAGLRLAGGVVTCNWSATSTSIDGVCRGQFELQVNDDCIELVELLPRPAEDDT